MALTAQSIVQRATQVIQDTTSTRWPARELTRWLNDAQREIVLYRPDANTQVGTGTLLTAATTRQTLVGMTGITNPAKLIDITRNMAASSAKKAVRLISREILDAQMPGWHSVTASVDIIHFMFDPRDPRAFYVYPQPTALAQLEIVYSAYPTDVTPPADGVIIPSSLADSDTSIITGSISLPDIYGNAILDYILYRAYMKDSDYAGNANRAQAHYTAFTNSLGVEGKALFMAAPNVNNTYNPNNLQSPKTNQPG